MTTNYYKRTLVQSSTVAFVRKMAVASNFGRLSLSGGLFLWRFCWASEPNCECWCSSESEKAWSRIALVWNIENLSLQSITYMGNLGSNTYGPYFHHGIYFLFASKKTLSVWIFSSTRATNLSMVWNIIVQNLICVDFHDKFRKQLDWPKGQYSRSNNRTRNSVRAPLENE